MKHVIILLLFSISIAFAQKSSREEEISAKVKIFQKITSGSYEPTANQLNYDVKYYALNLDINPANRYIKGSIDINLVIINNLSTIELDLSQGLIIDSIMLGNKKTTCTYSGNLLTVNLDKTYSSGALIKLTVFYQGYPGSSGFGSFGVSDVNSKKLIWTLSEPFGARDWWPCKDYPYDKADSADINITVPKEMIVASNGILRKTIETSDKKTYFWHEGYPISSYLISVTAYAYNTFSNYYKYSSTDSMEIKYFTVLDKYNPRYEDYDKVPNMIKVYSDLFGQYPFIKEKYGQAEFPWGGGMEHQTCTSLGSFSEFIIAHELAHQWWGDMITCKDFHNIWLNEGFATYCEALYAEKVYGKGQYQSEMGLAKYLGGGTVYVDDLSNINRIFSNDLTYNKASWVLHMLRHIAGDDTFFKMMKEYYKSIQQYNASSTEDFQKVCENVYGKDLNWFFHEWIYEEYYPQYNYMSTSTVNGSKTNLKIDISQKQTNYIFKMPVDVNITTTSGDTTIVVLDSLKSQSFNLTVNGSITKVELDKDEWILRTTQQLASSVTGNPPVAGYKLYQNFPNPFNPGTEISFYLPERTNLSIKVYDILGRDVSTLIEGKKDAGNYQIHFNSNSISTGLTSGIYFYKLTTDKFSDIKKMLLMK
jgi:aminopeptidase N